MGSSEIYGVVDQLPEITESLIVGFENSKDKYIIAAVRCAQRRLRIERRIEKQDPERHSERPFARHVPDEIYAVMSVPKTLNSKRLEVP